MGAFCVAILMGIIIESFFILTHTEPSIFLRIIIAVFCALSAHLLQRRYIMIKSR